MSEIITIGAFFISSASFGAVVMLFLVQRDGIQKRNEKEKVDAEEFWDKILRKDYPE